MIKLEYEYKGNNFIECNGEKIIMELADDVTWPNALDAFERFLKSAGYTFDAKFVEAVEMWKEEYGKKDEETA